jgi:hypothetical protein
MLWIWGGLGILILFVFVWHRVRLWVLCNVYKAPPIASGWVPFFGCIRAFATAGPAAFIPLCQQKYGSIFTIHVGGRYMTFLMDVKYFPIFFNSPEDQIDFQNATQPFLTQGFGVSKEAYFADHNTTLNCVRAKLLPKNLAQFHTPKLIQRFRQIWKEEWGNSGSGDLLAMIKHAVFWSSCDILFAYHDSQQNKIPKTGKLQQNKNKNKNENKYEDENENEDENKNEQAKDINSQKTEDELFFRAFENFDEDFELASSGIPHLLLRRFVRSKKYLLHRLGKVAQFYEALQSVEAHNNSTHPPKDMLLGKEVIFLFYFILFYFILFYFILFYFISIFLPLLGQRGFPCWIGSQLWPVDAF